MMVWIYYIGWDAYNWHNLYLRYVYYFNFCLASQWRCHWEIIVHLTRYHDSRLIAMFGCRCFLIVSLLSSGFEWFERASSISDNECSCVQFEMGMFLVWGLLCCFLYYARWCCCSYRQGSGFRWQFNNNDRILAVLYSVCCSLYATCELNTIELHISKTTKPRKYKPNN